MNLLFRLKTSSMPKISFLPLLLLEIALKLFKRCWESLGCVGWVFWGGWVTYQLPLYLSPALVGIGFTLGWGWAGSINSTPCLWTWTWNEMQIINLYDFSIYMPVTMENIQTGGGGQYKMDIGWKGKTKNTEENVGKEFL